MDPTLIENVRRYIDEAIRTRQVLIDERIKKKKELEEKIKETKQLCLEVEKEIEAETQIGYRLRDIEQQQQACFVKVNNFYILKIQMLIASSDRITPAEAEELGLELAEIVDNFNRI